jgi:hypothetical protein
LTDCRTSELFYFSLNLTAQRAKVVHNFFEQILDFLGQTVLESVRITAFKVITDIGHNGSRNLKISTPFGIEEKEGSRRCSAWAEGWEEDRETGLRILQAATSKTQAP